MFTSSRSETHGRRFSSTAFISSTSFFRFVTLDLQVPAKTFCRFFTTCSS
jgi:hypothetical protein